MATFDNTERANAVKAKLFADTIPRMPPIARFGCETARRRFVEIDGLRLSFLEWGIAGRPVICFLHGGSAHAHWFDLVAPAFVDRALVIVDSRPAIPTDRLDRLRRRGERTLRPYPTLEAAAQSFRLLPRETAADPAFLAHLGAAGVVERDGAWVYRFDPASNSGRRPVDAWSLLDRIAAPTLIARGELSPVLPRVMADKLRAAIRRATQAEIPASYHHLVLDNPAGFVRALEEFLAASMPTE